MKGDITISRRTRGEGEDIVSLEIRDADSGTYIVECHMTLPNFAKAVTGQAMLPAEIVSVVGEEKFGRIGKQMEHKDFMVNKEPMSIYSRNQDAEYVQECFDESGLNAQGWMLTDDGTTSQQYGTEHKATIRRWVNK